MNVRELTFKGEDRVRLYACGECGKCYSPSIFLAKEDIKHATARRFAESCCEPKTCERCGCGIESPYTACGSCRELIKLERAEIVEPDYGSGEVYTDDTGGSYSDGYSGDIDELKEWCEDQGEQIPCYVHPCHVEKFSFDPSDILDRIHDNHYEDATSDVVDFAEVKGFFEKWNAKQTIRSFHPDYKRVIVLDEAEFAALRSGSNLAKREPRA